MWTGPGPVPRDELMKNISGKDALFCLLTDRVDAELLDKAGPNLKVVATMSVGYDHLQLPELAKRGIKVGYTPDTLTDATAELTVALLLATSRRLFEANRAAKNGGWRAWSPFWMCGPGLKNSTVGVVGFGRIGQKVAEILKGFNVAKILNFNRSERKEAEKIGAERVSFDDLLKRSDFVVATCALTPETQHLFDEKAFSRMKPSAVFVNSSRGGLVDQEALVKALQDKRIWGAGLDVMTPEPLPLDHPLLKMDNCVILPHIGSAAIETRQEMALITAKNVIAGLKGETMPFELNNK